MEPHDATSEFEYAFVTVFHFSILHSAFCVLHSFLRVVVTPQTSHPHTSLSSRRPGTGGRCLRPKAPRPSTAVRPARRATILLPSARGRSRRARCLRCSRRGGRRSCRRRR